MSSYEVVIGLEVHVQLSTQSKLFCGCSTAFGAKANSHVCPVCTGMPGVLPVVNEKAVEYAVRMGLATNCTINDRSVFARKNYFYPDLPSGYQISQFERPICEHGRVDIELGDKAHSIRLNRIHLENDAGKNIHSAADKASYVDLNRAGVPLIEIVSEPDLRSSEEAVAFLKALHALVTGLDISDGNMEEGSFRCDANVSLRPRGQEAFGTRAEIKNLNSFRNVQRAIEVEIIRQSDILDDKGEVVQETRLYDAVKNTTASMRGKEEAHDYRYFPDPDLIPLVLDPAKIQEWKENLPELPQARKSRFLKEFSLSDDDATTLLQEKAVADYFEEAVKAYNQPKRIAHLTLGALLRWLNQEQLPLSACKLSPENFAQLARILDEGLISAKIANDIFADLAKTGASPEAYVKEKGLLQVSDTSAIDAALAEVLAENPDECEAYRNGKTKLEAFFVGQVMRKMKGKANPSLVIESLKKLTGC